MSSANEIIAEFLVESHDNLARLDQDLIALEQGSAAPTTLGSIFRTLHTLKGSAGFLGFQNLESLAHAAEILLSRLREGKLTVSSDIITALLAAVDAVRAILRTIESSGRDSQHFQRELIARLTELSGASAAPVDRLSAKTDPELLHSMTVHTLPPGTQLSIPSSPANVSVATPAAPETKSGPKAEAPATPEPTTSKVVDASIRLDVARIDRLLNLVSELVLVRNQLLQHTALQQDPALATAARNLNLITSELQEVTMSTRMQPIGNIWNPLPRIVRDLAAECGKRVRLETEGAQTELDKSVVEAMKDPLTHLVRNAVDHGIEPLSVRIAAGKPVEGRLLLRAYHESGQVYIEISDDGGGIDTARIKQRAVERGLLTAEQAETLSERAVLELIFLPGFSTSETVTHLSGRGVGMDVVKNNIERIGGSVDVHSMPGVGTTIKMRIPLTLAIIKALLIASGGQRYAIPQASMIELIRLDGDAVRSQIERLHDVCVYRFRGQLVPLVHLTRFLAGRHDSGKWEAMAADLNGGEAVNIAVLQADDLQFGLVVDRIHDTQEIVVKPLNKLLRGAGWLAGATILGDGRVALILDVLGLAQRAVNMARATGNISQKSEVSSEPAGNGQQLVLVRGEQGAPLAVPLQMVTRLEVIPAADIEWSGSRPVLQYRGSILPLIDVVQLWRKQAVTPRDARQPVHVVVCTDGTRSVGLVVEQILDIVADPLLVQGRAGREHVLCTAVVQRQVTEVLDVAALLGLAESTPV